MEAIWIIGSIFIGAYGSDKAIGFWGAFFLSIFLSPLVGLIFTVLSKESESVMYDRILKETKLRIKAENELLSPVPTKSKPKVHIIPHLEDEGLYPAMINLKIQEAFDGTR